ncbi:GNAT family N-acetyltransferase [Psychromonas sp. MME2]|uniref:GNAT family N-acetyltransferase n=1 Tax=Psychromonas sp. MME2 TaxID=3231033 RepID=UPI00339C6174
MSYQIQAIGAEHDHALRLIIESVGAEYGAIGEGFGPSDEEVKCMSKHYQEDNKSLYLVAIINGKVVGGCGIAPFIEQQGVCELRKLFLIPESRGLGIGKALAQACLDFAKHNGFQRCYLDTLATMQSAIALYMQLGFTHLSQPFGDYSRWL